MRYLLAIIVMLVALPAWADSDVILPKVEFSATAVQQSGAVELRQRIHYANARLRIDGVNGLSTTILDLSTQTQVILMENHTYLVLPMDNELFRRFFARPLNVNGARKRSVQRIEGMMTTKYMFDADGALNAGGYYWQSDTGIMVRREYEEGVFGRNVHHVDFLTDIEVVKQPPSLFVVPPGYKLTH